MGHSVLLIGIIRFVVRKEKLSVTLSIVYKDNKNKNIAGRLLSVSLFVFTNSKEKNDVTPSLPIKSFVCLI